MGDEADPVALTLAEALAEEPGETFIWGEGAAAGLGDSGLTDDLLTHRNAGTPLGTMPADPAEGGRRWPRVVLLMPRAKVAFQMRLGVALGLVAEGGELWVAGHQRDGIRSAEKLLRAADGATRVARLKRRCRVIAHRPAAVTPAAHKPLTAWEAVSELTVRGHAMQVVSYPGVFGHGKLDAGTARLIATLEQDKPKANRALDLGCGAGALTLTLARLRPDGKRHLVDVSAAACAAATQTLARNGVEGEVQCETADRLPEHHYSLVVSNLPRHRGREHAHDLPVALVAQAADRLKRGGLFYCVANHNKALTAALQTHFHRVEVASTDPGYRVWKATR